MIGAARVAMLVAVICPALPAQAPPLHLSHTWIVVKTGAPERGALEKAGFRPDSTVPVSPALQVGAEKFRLKSAWRETGYSPIGVVFDRTPATPDTLPFPTWRISADWMTPGTFIEMMTPRETWQAVSLSISSHAESTRERENEALARDAVKGAVFLHPNGARRLTALRVVAPRRGQVPARRRLPGFTRAREV